MAKQLVGKAALSLVRTANGSMVYVYSGQPVPQGADEADVKRLVDEGFLVVVGEDEPEDKPVRRSSRGSRSPRSEQSDGQEPGSGDGGGDDGSDGAGDGPPLKAAGKDAWVDFAVSKRAEGVSEDDARTQAEALTKNELIARFGV